MVNPSALTYINVCALPRVTTQLCWHNSYGCDRNKHNFYNIIRLVPNPYVSANLIHPVSKSATFGFQKCHFRLSKVPLSVFKSATVGLQKCHFRSSKVPHLQFRRKKLAEGARLFSIISHVMVGNSDSANLLKEQFWF